MKGSFVTSEKMGEELVFQKQRWDKLKEERKQLKELKDQVQALQVTKEKMCDLAHELLNCRSPSPAYPLFLQEQYHYFPIGSYERR
jgi:hypothetical protein